MPQGVELWGGRRGQKWLRLRPCLRLRANYWLGRLLTSVWLLEISPNYYLGGCSTHTLDTSDEEMERRGVNCLSEVPRVLVAWLCPTLCDPVDCSPPGSSVHGILQARILEWVAIHFSRASSRSGSQTRISISWTCQCVLTGGCWGPGIKERTYLQEYILEYHEKKGAFLAIDQSFIEYHILFSREVIA